MHIALVISALPVGGAERVLSELANRWAGQGHQVSLMTLAPKEAKPFYHLDSRINLIQLNQSGAEYSLIKRFRNILKRIFCLRKTLKKLNLDVVISFVDTTNLITLLAGMGLGLPVIVSERTHPAYYKIPCFYEKLRYVLYPRASCVVVQTNSAAAYFKKLNNLLVIPNAVFQSLVKKENYSGGIQKIVSLSRLDLSKNFDVLIQAFAPIQKKYPHLKLFIYGEGADRGRLEKLIESLNLQENVFLPGTIQDVYQVLSEADLFVFPSRYEGVSNALCEAMAVGLPVIASNCSGNVDIVRDGIDGRLFPVGDVARLTELMEELINDAEQRKCLGEAARTVCERFHPDRINKLWDDVIAQAMAK